MQAYLSYPHLSSTCQNNMPPSTFLMSIPSALNVNKDRWELYEAYFPLFSSITTYNQVVTHPALLITTLSFIHLSLCTTQPLTFISFLFILIFLALKYIISPLKISFLPCVVHPSMYVLFPFIFCLSTVRSRVWWYSNHLSIQAFTIETSTLSK